MKTHLRFIPLVLFVLFADAGAVSAESSIEGVVLGPDQRPVADAQVQVYSFEYPSDPNNEPAAARTDPSGFFSVAIDRHRITVVIAKKKGMSYGWKTLRTGQNSFSMQLTEPNPFSGQVVDEAGKPVADAHVKILLLSTSQRRYGVDIKDILQNPYGRSDTPRESNDFDFLSTQTDAHGQFCFSDFPAGAGLDVRIDKEGYAIFVSRELSSTRYSYKSGTSGHIFTLVPESVLEGTVIDEKTRAPAKNVPVNLGTKRRQAYNPFPEVRTDTKGQYSFKGLWADEYRVTFDPSCQTYLGQTQAVKLTKGQHKTDFQVSLSTGGTLEVKVVNAKTQQPIEEASVFVLCKTKKHSTCLRTDIAGQAQKRYLPDDFYITEVEAQGYRRDLTERTLTIEDEKVNSLILTLEEYPRLEGMVVRPDGTPAADITVHLLHGFTRKDPKPMSWGLSKGPKIPWSVQTDSTGRFVFWLLATAEELEDSPDAYPVFAYAAGQNLFVADKVPFGLTDTTLKLKPGIKVTGSLADQHGAAVTEGSVSLSVNFKTGPNSSSSSSMSGAIDHNGHFEFAGVPTDPQGLTLNFYHTDYKRFSGKVDPGQAKDGVVTLQPIAVHRADVIVKGEVLYPDGRPVDGATVRITESLTRYVSDSTDEQGCFELTVFELPVEVIASKNIPPGGSHSGTVTVTDKDKDVTITIRAADDKETFLPVIPPQPNSIQTDDKPESEKVLAEENSYSPSSYVQPPKEAGILFGASIDGQIVDDFILDRALIVSGIRWWGRDLDQGDFTIRFFKGTGSGPPPDLPLTGTVGD